MIKSSKIEYDTTQSTISNANDITYSEPQLAIPVPSTGKALANTSSSETYMSDLVHDHVVTKCHEHAST